MVREHQRHPPTPKKRTLAQITLPPNPTLPTTPIAPLDLLKTLNAENPRMNECSVKLLQIKTKINRAYIGLLITQRLDMFQQTRKSPNKNKHIQPSTTHLLPIINIPTSLGNILANPYHQKLQQQQQQNSSYTTSRKPRNVNSAPFHPETTSADSTTAPMSDLSGT